MAFSGISIFGRTGLVLLPLMACSTRSPSDSARTGNPAAQNERVDQPIATKTSQESPCTEPLNPEKLKWKNSLIRPAVYVPEEKQDDDGVVRDHYQITVQEADVQMLPEGCPTTQVLAYGGLVQKDGETKSEQAFSSPGPTFEMKRGTPARVQWFNKIGIAQLFPVDPTLHWANPNNMSAPTPPFAENRPPDTDAQSPIPIVTHVHGLEVDSRYDGAPDAWFTAKDVNDKALHGPKYDKDISFFEYPNSQPATALWYHDHALGITR
ncbi:MAG TPA: hypothetical protein VGJ91_04925, partial [Polyangiaceae bacterium]